MDQKIHRHEQYVRAEIEKLEKDDSKDSVDRLKKLYKYHVIAVRDFQHERLTHLIVTLFFAILFLFSLGVLFLVAISSEYTVLLVPLLLISLILLVTELFYIRHYFKLENGVQELYKLTKKLHDLI